MPKKVVAVVPGILGSALYYDRKPAPVELWSDNLLENYARLCDQPACLNWADTPAQSRLIKTMRTSRYLPFIRRGIYEKLIATAHNLPDVVGVVECSYDWRDSVLQSCFTIARQINEVLSPDSDLVLIGHSLGGLVIKAAIAAKLIHPTRINRLVYIGSPLYGSPAAFRSMYAEVDLPFFSQYAKLFRALKKETFRTHLLSYFRTFPSLAQLLPAQPVNYLCYSTVSRSNPLNEPYLPEDVRRSALEAQAAFRKANQLLQAENVPTFSVFTSADAEVQTDHEYLVKAIADPVGYEIVRTYFTDHDGDGTVPAYSAKGGEECRSLPVINCKHAFMCEANAVLDALAATGVGAARATG